MSQSAPRKRRKKHSAFVHWLEYVCLRAISALACLPSYRVALAIARACGSFCYYCLPLRKGLVLDNLHRAFPENDDAWRRATARESYRQGAMTFIELLRLPALRKEEVGKLVTLEGEEHMRAAGWDHSPYCVCCSHMSGWEHVTGYFNLHGLRFGAVAKRIHNPYVNDWITRLRESVGTKIIYVAKDMRAVAKYLRREKAAVLFVNDQDARRAGIFVDFFGHPASTFTGPAYFALRMKIPFLPAYQHRHEDDPTRTTVVIKPPVEPPAGASRDDAIRHLLTVYTRHLEAIIRAHPGQYFWFHKRWKTQPKNETASKANSAGEERAKMS